MLRLIRRHPRLADLVLAPLIWPCALLLKLVRTAGVQNLPRCKDVLLRIGVFPVERHYYEPQFDNRDPRPPFHEERDLPAIDWNEAEQLRLLDSFSCEAELADVPQAGGGGLDFHFNNGSFESGDAEYWYQLIRSVKPKRIIEIGSGNSTRMAIRAIRVNRREDSAYQCDHVCVEPYEMAWLDESEARVVRRRVEELDLGFFSGLGRDDILFIDSSHMIKPQGDVVFEYLQLLPSLNPGVIVHVHDIFSPRNYPREWLADEVKFWNEQYLLEAFLSFNPTWKIVGALNYLHHRHYERLKAKAPFLTPDREPGSFYLRKAG
ncbi:MAG TPA: class I SAM-dependent methyltransferase [Stellaceae bacterium]|nr:class I SAM-dependent methyltransferase [Stellaceae bacterium]